LWKHADQIRSITAFAQAVLTGPYDDVELEEKRLAAVYAVCELVMALWQDELPPEYRVA
jgi:hypothetical protein